MIILQISDKVKGAPPPVKVIKINGESVNAGDRASGANHALIVKMRDEHRRKSTPRQKAAVSTQLHSTRKSPSKTLKRSEGPKIQQKTRRKPSAYITPQPTRIELSASQVKTSPNISRGLRPDPSQVQQKSNSHFVPPVASGSGMAKLLASQKKFMQQPEKPSNLHEPSFMQKLGDFTFSRKGAFAGLMLLLLFFGIFASRSKSDLFYRIAADSAGIEAKAPEFSPSGFVLSERVEYAPGTVSATYLSSSTDRSYKVAQTATSWDSRALHDRYIKVGWADDNEAIIKNGLTLYLYGDGNISWVNGGIWYNVTSQNALSPSQLIDVAISI